MKGDRQGTSWQFSMPGCDEITFVVVETSGHKKVTHKVLVLIGGTIETNNGGKPQLFEEGKTYELAEPDDWDKSQVLKRIA